MKEAEAAGQVPVLVTIPLFTMTQAAVALFAPATPLIRRLVPLFKLKLMSPVPAVPSVNVCRFVVPMLPRPSRDRALLPLLAEILAVGVLPATFKKPNFADAVAVAPSSRAWVVFRSKIVPLA